MTQPAPQKIIIDTDPGIDDAMAIHQAFADDRLDVVGLTTIFGNVTAIQATRNALHLADMAGHPAAVAGGAPVPLRRAPEPPADFVHGPEGFGGLPAPTPGRAADPRSAAVFLCESCAAAPGDIIICAVGPLTNLAAALAYDPSIARHAKRVVVMGGSVARHGNVTDCAEANIWNDPDAADLVFAADWDVTMVGLDVTEKTRCYPQDFAAIAARSPIIGGFLNGATEFYFDFHEAKLGERLCFMHDPSAILAITDQNLFEFETMPISVICSGAEIGRTIIGGPDRREVSVAMRVESQDARQRFLEIMARADERAMARRRTPN
ncbi:nucleoside hydrolase [Alphaproteobacteria bacterium LSUCC0719]